MLSVETDGTEKAAGASRYAGRILTEPSLVGGESPKAFRLKLGAVTIGLLFVNLAIGLLAHEQQRRVIDYAIDIYDTSFTSTNYIHHAQISFEKYSDVRVRAVESAAISLANELLTRTIDLLDVAIERSNSLQARNEATTVKEKLVGLADIDIEASELSSRLETVAEDLERLGQRAANVVLRARDDVDDFASRNDLLMLASILTSITLAGLALIVLHRMVNSAIRSRTQFSAALEGMPQGLCMVDSNLRLLVCNTKYAQMYGLSREHTKLGSSLRTILEHRVAAGICPVDVGGFVEESLASASDPAPGSTEHQLRDGRIISVLNAPLSTGGGVAIHMDVTEKRKAEKEIEFLAHHDTLTGLANRVHLRGFIEQRLKDSGRGTKFSVLCLDLDHFKNVNDTLGHPNGDALLRAASERLRALLRNTDLIARTGGDEFSIVQTDIEQPMADAAALAERIVMAMHTPFDLGDHQVVAGTSIGIAIAPDDGTDPDQLLKNADMALYRAKADGRGMFHFFEAEMDARAQARRVLELDLRRAIAAGEFEIYYQPIVNLAENKISGFEALLRWNHPTRGRVPPNDFIPLAEETGLIVPIGDWVLRQACVEASTWPGHLRIAVNVSPLQFRNKNLATSVVSALAASGLAPNRLELEITEAVLLHNNVTTLALLHQIRALGVRISMDDFGTGYSSLSYLRSFPFDKIKIDQCFVHDLANNPDAIAIIRAVAALGKSFGMITTAEGVETAEQLDQMRAEGCTEVQGYICSKPIPAGEIAELLSEYQTHAQAAA
jgi:diguanylate cyclase (GGDEF)-like protein